MNWREPITYIPVTSSISVYPDPLSYQHRIAGHKKDFMETLFIYFLMILMIIFVRKIERVTNHLIENHYDSFAEITQKWNLDWFEFV